MVGVGGFTAEDAVVDCAVWFPSDEDIKKGYLPRLLSLHGELDPGVFLVEMLLKIKESGPWAHLMRVLST